MREGEDEVKWAKRPTIWERPPQIPWDASKFVPMEPGIQVHRELVHGDTVEDLQIVHLPGHCPGCIAILDKEDGRCFCGDVVYADKCSLVHFDSSDEDRFLESIDNLKRMAQSSEFRIAFPGHYGILSAKQVIAMCQKNRKSILKEQERRRNL